MSTDIQRRAGPNRAEPKSLKLAKGNIEVWIWSGQKFCRFLGHPFHCPALLASSRPIPQRLAATWSAPQRQLCPARRMRGPRLTTWANGNAAQAFTRVHGLRIRPQAQSGLPMADPVHCFRPDAGPNQPRPHHRTSIGDLPASCPAPGRAAAIP